MVEIKNLSLPTNENYAISLLHTTYSFLRRSLYKPISSTKTKAEVKGGGRKPWKQKGTGNARAGSIRSPLWRGGGVIFGPKPRTLTFRLNLKVKQISFVYAFFKANKKFIFFNENDLIKFCFLRQNLINFFVKKLKKLLLSNFFIISNNNKFLKYKLNSLLKMDSLLIKNLTISHLIFSKILLLPKYFYLMFKKFSIA